MALSRGFVAGTAAITATAAAAVPTLVRYRSRKREAIERLTQGSQIAQTAAGPIEYATLGEGPAILVVHGIAGGYDQGLLTAKLAAELSYGLIAISRPGYLRTPLEVGASPEAQADAYVGLLDAIGVEKAAIAGISAGGPSSIQFALRHPDRCWGLLLISAVSQRIRTPGARVRMVANTFFYSDFIWWVATMLATERMMGWRVLSPEVRARIDEYPGAREVLLGTIELLPTSRRRVGFDNDVKQLLTLPAYPLEEVTVPTFVLHGTDDPVVPLSNGELLAEKVPGARLLKVEGGGHLCVVTHSDEAMPAIMDFLRANSPRVIH